MGEVVGVNCSEAGEMFSPCLDHQLDREEEVKLQKHLEGCLVCSRELAEWKRVADALRQFGQEEIAAPEGFSTALMARIENEKASPLRVDWKRWKQAAIGTAAALLLAAGSLIIRTDHFVQLADQGKQVQQTQNTQTNTGNDNLPQETTTSGTVQKPAPQEPGTASSPKNTPPVSNSGSQTILSIPEFTSTQNHVILSTFLKLKVDQAQDAEAAAISLAKANGASLQSLGQQSEGGTIYLVDKIVIEGTQAQHLIDKLAGLGTTVSKQEQKEDVSKNYSDKYAQLIQLKNQRALTQDGEQIASLDQQIAQVEQQLRSWDVQSQRQTIVLWLQQ